MMHNSIYNITLKFLTNNDDLNYKYHINKLANDICDNLPNDIASLIQTVTIPHSQNYILSYWQIEVRDYGVRDAAVDILTAFIMELYKSSKFIIDTTIVHPNSNADTKMLIMKWDYKKNIPIVKKNNEV